MNHGWSSCVAISRTTTRPRSSTPSALLGHGMSVPPTRRYADQKKAAAIFNGLLADAAGASRHRALPDPQLRLSRARRAALNAARAYAKIAPSAPHALHMPSHIFTRLGIWQETIDSNVARPTRRAICGARGIPARPPSTDLHAYDYLEYAYLQRGEDDQVRHW